MTPKQKSETLARLGLTEEQMVEGARRAQAAAWDALDAALASYYEATKDLPGIVRYCVWERVVGEAHETNQRLNDEYDAGLMGAA